MTAYKVGVITTKQSIDHYKNKLKSLISDMENLSDNILEYGYLSDYSEGEYINTINGLHNQLSRLDYISNSLETKIKQLD